MADILRRLILAPKSQATAWGVALIYLVVFMFATGELAFDGTWRQASAQFAPGWANLILRQRSPFQFETVAIISGPFITWLVSPVNIAFGAVLGLLTGAQIAVVGIARHCAVSCGLSPAAGLLAGLPGLLAG